LPVAARRSGGVQWIVELSGGYGRVADGDDPESFARAIEGVIDGPLPVDAATARARLVEAVGEAAVARRAIELYRSAADGANDGRRAAPDGRYAPSPPGADPGSSSRPVATRRFVSWRRCPPGSRPSSSWSCPLQSVTLTRRAGPASSQVGS